MMLSPYDILGVPQNANDATIKTAFHRTAKACHPDLHAADPTAEQRLRQAVAAYEVLKNPEQRAALDRHLKASLKAYRRKQAQRFAVPALAGLGSAGAMAFVVWLSFSPSHTEIVSSLRVQREPLATEWKQIAASSDPKAIWAFAVRNSGTPESQLAQSRLVELIDAAVDVPTLQVLRLVAADAIAQRARERLLHLEGWDFAKPDSVVSAAPASEGAAINEVKPEEALAQAAEARTIREAKRVEPALQAPEKAIQEAKREEPPLQPYETNKEAPGEEPAPARPAKISRNVTAKLRATNPAPLPQAASENKSTPACSGSRSCASSVSNLFGVGF
jgi:curved DNA-binding protein CbpA